MNNFELDMQEFGKPGVPDSRGAEYFVDEAPPFRCPHGMSRVETLEDLQVLLSLALDIHSIRVREYSEKMDKRLADW